jgi:uncharacterized protein
VAFQEIGSVHVPPGQGAACTVQRGQVLRVVDVEGGQVADFNAWCLPDFKEQFWSGRTRILEGAHLSTGNRLWSSPSMKVMFTITADTVKHTSSPLGGNRTICCGLGVAHTFGKFVTALTTRPTARTT